MSHYFYKCLLSIRRTKESTWNVHDTKTINVDRSFLCRQICQKIDAFSSLNQSNTNKSNKLIFVSFFPPTHLILTTKKACNVFGFRFQLFFQLSGFYFWICIVVVVFTSTAHTEFSSRAKMTSNRYAMIEMAEDSNETEQKNEKYFKMHTRREHIRRVVVVIVVVAFTYDTCNFLNYDLFLLQFISFESDYSIYFCFLCTIIKCRFCIFGLCSK